MIDAIAQINASLAQFAPDIDSAPDQNRNI